jgi:phospholipase C
VTIPHPKTTGAVAAIVATCLLGVATSPSLRKARASVARPSAGAHAAAAAARGLGDAPLGACPFTAGARAKDTLPKDALPSAALTQTLPVRHVIILMQENRSFDHYFGRLQTSGQPDADGIPDGYGNRDREGRWVSPFHLPSTCLPGDPPHQWDNMHAHWNGGRMDGFLAEAERKSGARPLPAGFDDDDDDATGGGRYVLGTFDGRDIPFYYYLANTFTVADRYFASAMAGTWPNRQFLYTGTAQSPRAATGMLTGTRTIFDNLDDAGVSWTVFNDGSPRQDCIGWTRRPAPQHRGPHGARNVQTMNELFAALHDGTLPAVSFVDPIAEDEHPPGDIQRGENWTRRLFVAATKSPLWPSLALLYTYDEGGGFFDHVAPPPACAPSADKPELDHRGTRVPLVVISPWARRHHVSHVVHDHTSMLRFVELLFDLPALSARDANADALLDAFDFDAPPRLEVPAPPPAGHGGCKRTRLIAAR